MLEGSSNSRGTFDRNLEMGASRNQEAGGLPRLSSQGFHDSDERELPSTHAYTVMETGERPPLQTSESSHSPFSTNMDLPSTSSIKSSTPDSISTVTADTTPSWSSIWQSRSYRTSQTSLDSTNSNKSFPLREISSRDISTTDLCSFDYGEGSSTQSTRTSRIPDESSPPAFTLPPPMLSPMEPSPPLTLPEQLLPSAISPRYSNPPSLISPISPGLALSYNRKPLTVQSATPVVALTFEVWRSQARERKPGSSFLGHRFGKKRASPPRADEGRSILHGSIIRIPELLSYLDTSSLSVLARTCKRMQYEVEKKRYHCVHLLGDTLVKPFELAMSKDPRRAHFVVQYSGSLWKGEWLHDAINMKHLVISRYNNTTGFFSTGPFPFHLETFELRDSAPNFYKGQEIANHIRRFLETQRSLRSIYIEDNTNYHIFLEQFKPLSVNACPRVVAFGGNIFAAEVFFPSRKILYFQWDQLADAIPFAGGYQFVFEEFLSRIAKPLSKIRALSVSLSDKPDLCLPPSVHAFGSFFPSLRFLEIKNLSDQDLNDMQVLRNLHALYISSEDFEGQQRQIIGLFSICPALHRVDYSQMDLSSSRRRYYRWSRGSGSPNEVSRRMVESGRTEFLGEANRGISLNFSSSP
ncbi:hypothetical protein M413DRAFT_448133 [Hebeloma cylindrosporum]|uniref:F-box domain-containing protein n=1 Tax=Hebeloma cylindrosporum TaxID=76867 RepID=A0A0C3C2K8_HEBCY|nr:hypothetical protein M413DRAFT_448133 [Hebeloma cylindrosporum h7]